MSSYKTIEGDTFAKVSRKRYGSELSESLLQSSNVEVSDPLPAGKTLIIPERPGDPVNKPTNIQAADENEVAITIDGQRFRFWERVTVRQAIGKIASFSFTAPYDKNDPQQRKFFKPFQYNAIQVFIGGSVVFTGTLISIIPNINPNSNTISVSGYATPGSLRDCTPPKPSDSYPLEFENVNIVEIAQSLAAPFGVSVVAGDGAPGEPFERVQIEPDQTIFPFLTFLAKQRDLLITSDALGRLVFQKGKSSGVPVVKIEEGSAPGVSVTGQFDSQRYYTHITALEPVVVGLRGGSFTVENPHVKSTPRPFTFKVGDTQGTTVEQAAKAKAGRMFASMASYTLAVPDWRDPLGILWAPNTLVSVDAPGAMINGAYTFLIRAVEFNRTKEIQTTNMELVFPTVYSGEIPESLPWDG